MQQGLSMFYVLLISSVVVFVLGGGEDEGWGVDVGGLGD